MLADPTHERVHKEADQVRKHIWPGLQTFLVKDQSLAEWNQMLHGIYKNILSWSHNIYDSYWTQTAKKGFRKRSDYQADVCWQILNTIKQTSVGKYQILSSRCLLANLKYYQADDVTSHKRLSYLERLCFAIPCVRIVFRGDSSSVLVVDWDFPGSNPTSDNYFHFLFFHLNSG